MVLFAIESAAARALPPTIPQISKWLPGTSHPSNAPSRRTCDQREVRYISRDDSARRHHRPPANGHRGDAHRSCTHGRSFADRHADGGPIAGPLETPLRVYRPWIEVVREDNPRADEDAVGEDGWLVDLRIVLHFASITDPYTSADVGTPTDDALLTDNGVSAQLGQVPHDRASAYHCTTRDVGAFGDPGRAIVSQPSVRFAKNCTDSG